jgi:hypothetical protein
MAKFRIVLEDDTLEHMIGPVVREADTYGTSSTSGELYLTKDGKSVATFADGEWAAVWLVEEEPTNG